MRYKKMPRYYQSGGAVSMPFATYTPVPVADTSNAAVAADTSKDDLTDKDLLGLLEKMDGLPSDMAVITKRLQNFYIDKQYDTMRGSASYDTSSLAVRYLGLVNQIRVANFNKKEYDNAFDQVTKNGGIDEWAITDRGQFVCMNEDGDFKFMTANQLKDDSEAEDGGKYMPLTNSELLYYRANSTDLANQNKLLSVVQNGIGMETVTKLIQNVMNSMGTTENSQEGYASAKKGKLVQGLQDFEQAVQQASLTGDYDGTVNDLYKYKYLTKSQADNAAQAFNYIYSALPTNAKALLKAKSDLTEEGAQKLVQTLIASTLDTKTQFDVSLEGGTSAKSLKDATNTSTDNTKLKDTQLIDFVKGISGVKQTMTVDRGDGIQMSLIGRKTNLLFENDQKTPITGDMSLADMLSRSGIQNIVSNLSNITFGDQHIDPEALSNITYNNTGVLRANLPINSDGTVDFSVLEKFEKAEQDLENLGHEASDEERKKIYESVGLSDLLLSNGQINPARFGAFLVTEGYTTNTLSGIEDSDFVREIDKWNSKREAQIIENSLSGTDDKKRKRQVKVDRNSIWPGDWSSKWYDHIYKAAIYIPITDNPLIAARTDQQNLDYYNGAMPIEYKYQNADKIVGMQTTSASALGQKNG